VSASAAVAAEVPLAEAVAAIAAVLGRARAPAGIGLDLAARRAAHEPLAHITGRREFWSLDLAVSPATLIPRPETETLIEAALAACPDRACVRRVLDLGTGTGALLLAALTEFPAAFGIGVDVSEDAAMLARRNAVSLGLADRTAMIAGHWADSLSGRFDLILANPPYVAEVEIDDLMPDVSRYEPRRALAGGADGLSAYRQLLPELPRLLGGRGVGIVELGAGQAAAVSALARRQGFAIEGRADLTGVTRALVMTVDGR
jgi:release factor glutamine methyltransferase